ncbi:hypothetical protein HZC07_04265 [Candidatus Micrarchaeota archaeon]|nr:hypothetical protein [Candidatus Micrarchaeota archaeon]
MTEPRRTVKGPDAGHETDSKPGHESVFSRFRGMKGLIASLAVVGTLGLGHAGCGTYDIPGIPPIPSGHDSGEGGASQDAGPDAREDANEAGMDAGHDGGTGGEGGMDAGPVDAGPDSGEGGMGGADAGPVDAGPVDSGPIDSGPVDSGPVTCGVATTGNWTGLIPLSGSHTVGGYVFNYISHSGLDATLDITCGGNVTQNGLVCPAGVDTILDVPADGKRITVHNTGAGNASANVHITVENH